MPTLTRALRDLGGVFADGLRVLRDHWPTLIALYLAGFAVRMASIWVAVRAAQVSPLLAALITPLAPLATIVSFVLMLRVAAQSLPAFAAALADARTPWRDNLRVAALALVPFLAVYASQGLLAEDMRRFFLDAGAAEWARMQAGDFSGVDFSRAGLPSGPLAIGVAVAAMLLRKVLAGLELGERNARWASLAGYLEALWLTNLSFLFNDQKSQLFDWLTTRRAVAGIYRWWDGLVSAKGAAEGALQAPFVALGKLIGSLGSLVIVPVAWLALGATVYGASLKASDVLPNHEEATARLQRIPSPVRRVAAQAVEPVTTPVKNTLKAIGKVAAAGVLPMVLFCVVFAFTGWLRVGVDALAWVVLGPAQQEFQSAREPFVALVEGLVYFVITLALLAAAVNRVVLADRAAQESAEPAPEASVSAGA